MSSHLNNKISFIFSVVIPLCLSSCNKWHVDSTISSQNVGEPGISYVYKLYVSSGGLLSYEDWLSCVTNGQYPANGQSQLYQDGYEPTISIGENGHFFIDGYDTGVEANASDNKEELFRTNQILYEADTKNDSNYIVNAVAYNDGVIIAARSNGDLVRIDYKNEETLLTVDGENLDWRCLYMDSNQNVYASHHASWGSLNQNDRALYRLQKGASSFDKVLPLYDPLSAEKYLSDSNDDTIWTMCEDDLGYLYAGVYCHMKRPAPRIYRSIDGGNTWQMIFDFTNSSVVTGIHIHSIIYNRYNKALYAIVGETNTIVKSTDRGITWRNLNVHLVDKGASMFATPLGLLIGSDNGYNCQIDLLLNDDKTHKTVFKGFANIVFGIRESDLTGYIYAFTRIDSSVNVASYYPPYSAVESGDTWGEIEAWHLSVGDEKYDKWKSYYDSVKDKYPEDAIRPSHYCILVSKDKGESFEILKKFSCSSNYPSGFVTIGYSLNGEILAGRFIDYLAIKPVVLSERTKCNFESGGINLLGDVFIRTNESSVVKPL